LISQCVVNEAEAVQAVERLCGSGMTALIQEWAGGPREAVGVFRAGGKVLAEFAHLTLRTTPMLGGFCVVRESIPVPPELGQAARALVDAIDLDGYSHVEFRRDTRGRALLMEINPRLSASIELAVRSGVNFPLMLWRWASGGRVEVQKGYKAGVRMRWLAGDVRWLMEAVGAPRRPDSVPALRAVAMFGRDFARRSVYDYLDYGDLGPSIAELGHSVLGVGRILTKRASRASSVASAKDSTKMENCDGQD
jgi:hypothetical protein